MKLKKEIRMLVEQITGNLKVSFRKPIREVGVESLAYAELVTEVEDKYGIECSDEEIGRFRTLKEFTKYISGKVNR